MNLMSLFNDAESFVNACFPSDIINTWLLLRTSKDEIGKSDFLSQYAHVVYCSGFRWKVVDQHWDRIAEAWRFFQPYEIAENMDSCRREAMRIIGHEAKAKAIADTAKWLTEISCTQLTELILGAQENIDTFKRLPYIGDVTKYHLGICMGFDVIKPDVHIKRIADHFNMSPFEMCDEISRQTGHPKRIVDAILWRAAEQRHIRLNEGTKDE